MVQQEDLIFIHLSDIHFRKGLSETIHDFDQDIRDQLIKDAKAMREELGEIRGILVTGDIAFAGKEEEYRKARSWLDNLRDAVGCRYDDYAWVVPGNHDVDREVIKRSSTIQDCHERFRNIPKENIDAELRRKLTDEAAQQYLFDSIKNYNNFAKVFGCQISANQPYWESDVLLNDGSNLRLRGLNSTLISNEHDDDTSNKLILGLAQAICLEKTGVTYLSLCHHPPQWLRDEDQVDGYLHQRVNVQLNGHKHRQQLRIYDNSLTLTAGATHPERNGREWKPQYNFLAIRVITTEISRKLQVRVITKTWNDELKTFVPEAQRNGQLFVECAFNLPMWRPQPSAALTQARLEPITEIEKNDKQPIGVNNNLPITTIFEKLLEKEAQSMNRTRRLTYRFYTLPYNVRLKIAQTLQLIREDDKDVPDEQIFERYYQRAKDTKLLARLWDEIEQADPDFQVTENPFSDE